MRNNYALLCEVCAPKDKDYLTPSIGVVTGLCQICGVAVGASGVEYEWVPIAIARDTAAKRGLKFNEYGDGYTVTNGLVHPDGVAQIHPDSVELIHEFHDFPGVCTRVHVRPPKPGAVLVGAHMMLGDKNVTRAYVVWKIDPEPPQDKTSPLPVSDGKVGVAVSLEEIGFNHRALHCFWRMGIRTVEELTVLRGSDLLRLHAIGVKTADHVVACLEKAGLALRPENGSTDPGQKWMTAAQAAALLGLDEESLRARARRNRVNEVAELGPVVGVKFGRTWRFRSVDIDQPEDPLKEQQP